MTKTANKLSKFLIFIGLSLMYCIWAKVSYGIGVTLIAAVAVLVADLFVNYKYDTPYCVFMLASLAPAVLYCALFDADPSYECADTAFVALLLAAFRMLLSVFESVIRKKYYRIPIGMLLSAAVCYLSFALNDYQYDVLHVLGVFSPK